ncbi:MAG: homoserine dehydrogenase [Gemmataceae bacterium]
MTEPLGIALLGCGTVGGGVVRLLTERADLLATRAGRPLELRHVVVRDVGKHRDVPLPPNLLSDLSTALADPRVHVVAELVGGTGWARQAVLAALAAGKHVVTANKALLARHGPQVFEAARAHGRAIAFEASVAGGVPIIAALAQSMAANQVVSLQGILNGTSNFILSRMSEDGLSYDAALAEAQARGYAEADPTLDVDGSDAAHKLAILAQIAFGAHADADAVERRGIVGLDAMDIRFAKELGYTIKLVAEAWLGEGRVALHVAPVLLRHTDLLAQVRGAYNAVRVVGDAVGDTLYYGPGAGRMPTASAVVADLIDMATGRAQRTFQALRLWTPGANGPEPRPAAEVRSRFYLRLLVADRSGVLADVARALADEGISIASVIQHEALDDREGEVVPLVIMTHAAATNRFRAALAHIDSRRLSQEPAAYYPVAD